MHEEYRKLDMTLEEKYRNNTRNILHLVRTTHCRFSSYFQLYFIPSIVSIGSYSCDDNTYLIDTN